MVAVTDEHRADDLASGWFDGPGDAVARRDSVRAADTEERAAARASTLELLDLALAHVAEHVDALAAVAAEAEAAVAAEPDLGDTDATAPQGRPRRHDTEPMLPAVEPDEDFFDDGLEPEPEPDREDFGGEDDIDLEPEPAPTPPPTPQAKASARAARAAAVAAVEKAAQEDVLESAAAANPPRGPAVLERPGGERGAETADIVPPGVSGWQAEVELLYNDVLRLFSLGDTDGALVSLERLLIIAPINDQIRNFLRVNESKLMKLYEGVMGPWSNVPRRLDNPHAPTFFKQHAKFKTILHLVDGRRDLGSILEESYFLPLETCAVLNQLIRSKVILAHDVLG